MKLLTRILAFSLLAGCAIYEQIDERMHPIPAIQKQADMSAWQEGNQMDILLTAHIDNADMTLWYYHCLIDGRWRPYREVDNVKVTDGKASNLRKQISCWSKYRIDVVAYNNWGKRSQKSASMIWIIDIPSIIK